MDTPPGAPLKVKFRMEIEKLREMSFKKKLEHIWEYYKFHIIAILVFFIFIGSIINTLYVFWYCYHLCKLDIEVYRKNKILKSNNQVYSGYC